jgi:predicted HicB family RNase H-like nuclease
MSNYLEYKSYLGSVEYSAEDNLLCGEVVGIRGLIMFHGETLAELKIDFENAVDHYLSCCEEEKIVPETPCYGNLDVKISPAIHKQMQIFAQRHGKTQNETVEDALKYYMTA